MILTDKQVTKFWSKVLITSDDTKCWLWTRAKSGDYGSVTINSFMHYAHRVAYMLFNDVEPLLVRHTCDVKLCCNPKHLIDGSYQDNSNDMISRNRQAKGESSGKSKLSDLDIQSIKSMLAKGVKQKDIALKFNVSKLTICRINKNKARR